MDSLERDPCIRCGEAPQVDESEYCGHCYWVVRAEIDEGIRDLRAYLRRWLEFRDWEAGGELRSS
jgi:hypothetical protein